MKPAVSEGPSVVPSNVKQLPTLHDFINKRDYLGALALLEVRFCFHGECIFYNGTLILFEFLHLYSYFHSKYIGYNSHTHSSTIWFIKLFLYRFILL